MKIKQFSRDLRRRQTKAEKFLWFCLRNRRLQNCKFRRQHAIKPYIVDFVCLEVKLIIELDGGQHMAQQAYDVRRTCFLNARGFDVLRYWNDQVLLHLSDVLEDINRKVSQKKKLISSSCPSPAGEGTDRQIH